MCPKYSFMRWEWYEEEKAERMDGGAAEERGKIGRSVQNCRLGPWETQKQGLSSI